MNQEVFYQMPTIYEVLVTDFRLPPYIYPLNP